MSTESHSGRWKRMIAIQALVFLFSLSGMLTKLSALQLKRHGLWSAQFICLFSIALLMLAIYAYFWQRVLKKIDLSVAYLSKGVTLLWTLVWSICLFGESITLRNVLGLIMVMAGMLIINLGDAAEKSHHQATAPGGRGHHAPR